MELHSVLLAFLCTILLDFMGMYVYGLNAELGLAFALHDGKDESSRWRSGGKNQGMALVGLCGREEI